MPQGSRSILAEAGATPAALRPAIPAAAPKKLRRVVGVFIEYDSPVSTILSLWRGDRALRVRCYGSNGGGLSGGCGGRSSVWAGGGESISEFRITFNMTMATKASASRPKTPRRMGRRFAGEWR